MASLAVNEVTTYRWSFEEDVRQYVLAGLPAIGVWRHKLADYGEEKGCELLTAYGLKVSSLQWAGGFTGSDGRSHEESIDDAFYAIRLAAQLRAGCLIVHSGARGSHMLNHARRLFRIAIDRLLPLAESLNVTLAIEPMGSDCGLEWTFLNTIDEALKVIDSYKSPQLKCVLDTYHWGHEPATLERLPQLAPQLGLIQLGDRRHTPRGEQNRIPLGEGIIPLEQIVSVAVAAGYQGYFEVELLGEEIENLDYRQLLSDSRDSFASWAGSDN